MFFLLSKMDREEILDFCYSPQYEKLSTQEKRKCAAVYSGYRDSDVEKMENDAKIKKVAQLLKVLPADVFIEQIVLGGEISGKEVISVCASDPLFRQKCDYKDGLLYRKLLIRDFGLELPSETTLAELRNLYLELQKGYIYKIEDAVATMCNSYNTPVNDFVSFAKYNKQTIKTTHKGFIGITRSGDIYLYDMKHSNYIKATVRLHSTNYAKPTVRDRKLRRRLDFSEPPKLVKFLSNFMGRSPFCIDNKGFLYETAIFFSEEKGAIVDLRKIEHGINEPIKDAASIGISNGVVILTTEGNLYHFIPKITMTGQNESLTKLDLPPVKMMKNFARGSQKNLYILTMDDRFYTFDFTTSLLTEHSFQPGVIDFGIVYHSLVCLYKDGKIRMMQEDGDTEVFIEGAISMVVQHSYGSVKLDIFVNTNKLEVYSVNFVSAFNPGGSQFVESKVVKIDNLKFIKEIAEYERKTYVI